MGSERIQGLAPLVWSGVVCLQTAQFKAAAGGEDAMSRIAWMPAALLERVVRASYFIYSLYLLNIQNVSIIAASAFIASWPDVS